MGHISLQGARSVTCLPGGERFVAAATAARSIRQRCVLRVHKIEHEEDEDNES